MRIFWPIFLNDEIFSQIFSSRQARGVRRKLTEGSYFPVDFQRCSETSRRMMIFFLTIICQCSSSSIWEQMPVTDQSPAGHITVKPAGLSGGFWGSLLGSSAEQKQESEENIWRQSELRSERLVQSRRRVLPSSLRSLHTLNTEYHDQNYDQNYDQDYDQDYDQNYDQDYDYDYTVEQGEVFSPEESRADQVTKTHK